MKPKKESTRMNFLEKLSKLPPVSEIPIAWDATGYGSEWFAREVASPDFDGWSGDADDDVECAMMARLLGARRGASLLDVACGYGRHALILAQTHGLCVTGVDVVPALIDKARALAEQSGIDAQFEAMSAKDMGFVDRFDHAVIGYNSRSLFSPDDAALVLRRIHCALKEGGTLFLDIDNKPFHRRYGTCRRNWYLEHDALVLQDVYFREEQSVEVNRDVFVRPDGGVDEFLCFKRIYDASEACALVESNGFEVVHRYGNWDYTPVNEAGPKIILVVRRISRGARNRRRRR